MIKNQSFITRKFSEHCLWLKSSTDEDKIIYTLQEKEIIIENSKGVIPYRDISHVVIESIENDYLSLTLHIKENKKWNNNKKKKHPLLWRLGLISKSKNRTFFLGTTKKESSTQLIFEIFIKANIRIIEIPS